MEKRSHQRRDASPLSSRIQESLRASTREGVTAQVMLGILDFYLIPYALFLGAGSQWIGLLIAIPHLLSSLALFMAVRILQFVGSRKKVLLIATAIQTCALLPLGFLAIAPITNKVVVLILFVSLFRVLGSLFGPSWGSLVSEYLPESRRGLYFGMRSRIVGVSGLVAVAFWGAFLHFFRRASTEQLAFVVLFTAAAAFRVISFFYLLRMVDLPFHHTSESQFTFAQFLRRFRESNFVRFIFFAASMTFAVQLALPQFSVYMLEVLGFNYASYMTVHLSSVTMGFLIFPVWGRHADAVGNARILKSTSMLIPIVPLLWIVSRNLPALIATELFAGFVMGGFTLCTMNFIYDAVTPDKRPRCIGYFNIINGTAAFLGASIGGWLAEHLPAIFGHRLYALFLLSSVLRLSSDFFLSDRFTEARREVKPISSRDLYFSVVGFRPIVARGGPYIPALTKEDEPFHLRKEARRTDDAASSGVEQTSGKARS